MVSRRATRVRVAGARVCFVYPEQFKASLLEFSPFEFSVKSSRTFLPGTVVELEIQVGGQCFPTLSVVRSETPGGFGLECLIMTPSDQEMMQQVYRRLLTVKSSEGPSALDQTELQRPDAP